MQNRLQAFIMQVPIQQVPIKQKHSTMNVISSTSNKSDATPRTQTIAGAWVCRAVTAVVSNGIQHSVSKGAWGLRRAFQPESACWSFRWTRLIAGVAGVASAGLLAIGASNVHAADQYPTKPITLIVPFSAGGQYDTVARLVAKPLGDKLGQPVIIDNVGGAGGTVGGAKAAFAAPDGYTLLAYGGNFAIAKYLYKGLRFDPIEAFDPVSGVSLAPHALLVNAQLPVQTLEELVAYSKANPGTLNYASPGVGSSMNLVFEEIKSRTGLDAQHIPYKGGAQVLSDLAGGQVQAGIVAVAPALPLIEAGKIRAIAVTSKNRSANLPDVRTVAESGIPGYESGSWLSIVVAAGTPEAILNKLNQAINEVMANPELSQTLRSQSFDLIHGTPEALMARTKDDEARFGPIIEAIQASQAK